MMKNILNRKLSPKFLISFILWLLLIEIIIFSWVINAFTIITISFLVAILFVYIYFIFPLFIKKQKYDLKIILALFYHKIPITFIVVVSVILIILSFSAINFERRGINNNPLNVSFDIYILNNETDEENIHSSLAGANKIWKNYGISIKINLIENIYKNISDNETKYVFESGNCSLINPVINTLLKNSNNLSIIFMSNKNSTHEGRGCICNCTFLVVDAKKGKFSNWNLAHEIGHILNAEKSCWKWNLMTETSDKCYNNIFIKPFQELSFTLRKNLKPEFLNQKQVNNAVYKLYKLTPKEIKIVEGEGK